MASDAVTLIMNDHRVLDGLFEQLLSGSGERRALVAEVTARLTAHARAEESQVYPAVKAADPGEEAEVDHAYHEHDEAVHLLGKVRNLIDSPHFEQALTEFVAAVRHHVEEEETEVLPALRDAVDAATLEQLGEAFERARLDDLRVAGIEARPTRGDVADEPPADAPATPADDLADATREELYEMAREADIPGRSRMNKEELTEALREQR